MTVSIDIQHNSIECNYTECCDYLNIMLSVVMLKIVMLSVVRLNVVMLSVVAPEQHLRILVKEAMYITYSKHFIFLVIYKWAQ